MTQVGFNAGDGVHYYVVPASRTKSIVDISQQSNVELTGRWMFRVDQVQVGAAKCVVNPTSEFSSHVLFGIGLYIHHREDHLPLKTLI